MIDFLQAEKIIDGARLSYSQNWPLETLMVDSRKVIVSKGSIFFAIEGERNDGHNHILELYNAGIRQFVIEKKIDVSGLQDANIVLVHSSIRALQALACFHRKSFSFPVIGITGSNGKTIIKEWLYQLLSKEYNTVKNPGSYNSQVGVPLSVWQMKAYHQLGIFEAGISKHGEMQNLQPIIDPTIGIFTNVGSAHDEGFTTEEHKINEKLKLFKNVSILIYSRNHQNLHRAIAKSGIPSLSWGHLPDADIFIAKQQDQRYELNFQKNKYSINIPFTDQASVENTFHCIALMLYLHYGQDQIQERISGNLWAVPMRLELKEGINQCQVIDDTYNNDFAGLQISLDFLFSQKQKKNKKLILSDIEQSGLAEEEMVLKIANLVNTSQLDGYIGIGPSQHKYKNYFNVKSAFYKTTQDFLANVNTQEFQNELILIKGARNYHFEKIVAQLQKKVHGTVIEIDLGAMVHNLNFFKSRLKPTTKVMAMVKAFAYGNGSIEVASLLQYHNVHYLGVAYADEGVDLRKNNITLPIMVMNPSQESFHSLIANDLEPEIYSFKILNAFVTFIQQRACKIHIKIDTGMRRLGFEATDADNLIAVLKNNPHIKVASIFSHLAGADENQHDDFSGAQASLFLSVANKISNAIGYKPLYHILNSPGILRLPALQFDMVRLGIGLYGVDPTTNGLSSLKPVATLKTIISQIKHVKAGETIGYGRRGVALNDMRIATIAVGYADGFSRAFSRGVGEVLINAHRAKVIGNVCMDMTMVDVTGIKAEEGDEVILFGKALPIQEVASKINTIAYEILTNTSERVKRVFVAESI